MFLLGGPPSSELPPATIQPHPETLPPGFLPSSSYNFVFLRFTITHTSRRDILLRPRLAPMGRAFIDDVMASAWQPPIAYRRADANGVAIALYSPFATTQGQTHFRTASACAKVFG